MSRFEHNATGVVVTVADHKDERFGTDWTRLPAFGAEPAPTPEPEPKTPATAPRTPPGTFVKRGPGRPRKTEK